MYLRSVEAWLIKYDGNIPGCRRSPWVVPPECFWSFYSGWWMHYAVVVRKKWFRTSKKIVIVGIQDTEALSSSFRM